MIDIVLALRQRIADRAGDLFTRVGAVADYEAIAGMPRTLPCAYVLPVSEQAQPDDTMGAQMQIHDCALQVTYVTTHAGDASGIQAADALTPLREAVAAAIVGWTPPNCVSRVQFVRGALVEFIDRATVWQDDFSVQRRVQRTIN